MTVYNILNMDIFLTQMHQFTSDGIYPNPNPHLHPSQSMWSTFYDGWMLFIGLQKLNHIHCHYKPGNSHGIF